MKSFLVKNPPPGKTTASLVRQAYDKVDRRTKTTYVGSVNLSVAAAALPAGLNLRPGHVLTDADLAEVRAWLVVNSTHGRAPAIAPALLAQVRAEVRAEVVAEMRAEAPPSGPTGLAAAAATLRQAAADVRARAGELRAAGVSLTPGMMRSTSTAPPSQGGSEFDFLKALTNTCRAAFEDFEESLRETKLLVTRAKGH